ncbi:Vitamin k epoxide reductase [Aureococcus anophagefferens]|nr:Vitamin k epoxide reductase [Aureococcus anophagefferens]
MACRAVFALCFGVLAASLQIPHRSRCLTHRRATPVDTAPDDAGADLTSRKIVAGLAAVGVAETAYLSYSKLAAAPVMCASQACGGVLNSAYASVAGVPLAFFGFAAYFTTLALAAAPLVAPGLEKKTRWPLLATTSAMGCFSLCLLLLLAFRLQEFCALCAGSAVLTLTNAAVLRAWKAEAPPPRLVGAGAAALFAAGALFLAETDAHGGGAPWSRTPARAAPAPKGYGGPVFTPPDVTKPSTARSAALAAHLKAKGAKMYGAYWAATASTRSRSSGRRRKAIDYYECAEDGAPRGATPPGARHQGYPTWEIGGALPGEKTLDSCGALGLRRVVMPPS